MSFETSRDDIPSSSPSVGGKNVVFGRTVVPVPLRNKPLKWGMFGEYAEHGFIGDAINLTLAGGKKVPASDHKFKLTNGLVVTYGQINGLAGDFYGTTKPISDGKDAQEQSARFIAAYNTLAAPRWRQPKEAQSILRVLQTEVDAVNKALHDHTNPSEAYNKLPDVSAKLQWLTLVDDVDYFLLYGVVQERAALHLPLSRLVLNAPFIHDDYLVSTLEEYVEVNIIKDVDLDH
ncbi:hypothetical protein ONZ51_g11014 [Trametes cubensis]|uniref:Uncharacterized protein n=1 Tax=Trametes cubensis TaxID=1111947 RepID=A0AAD7X4D9_9APHY|nr:hypothetical protein ONZ51_g11014 [Trametes cubensis]